ncbi:hypothetical protein B0J11DRAFT_550842 [Dendryphion nanum]|uniref:Mucin n=1 Tax=Dendryphion nanum TaxID=256645 RepID=A0A9P9DRR9_9PLEO|nr:hypothetical protein B0J11DRAFT_550842 [Dendryphion nanum]
MTMKKGMAAAPYSHAEFEALPEAVQRKYFSSLERLRIADQHQQHQHQQHHDLAQGPPLQAPSASIIPSIPSIPSFPFDNNSRRSSSHTTSHRRSPSLSLRRSLTIGPTRRRRLRKAETLRQEQHLCQQDAHFFLSLPPKLQRQHFSREEQVLLAEPPFSSSSSSSSTGERTDQRFNDFRFGFINDLSSDSTDSHERGRGRPRNRSHSVSRSVSPFQVNRKETSARRGLRDSLQFLANLKMSPPTSYQSTPPTPTFRRTLSLTNMPMPFRHSTSSAPPTVDPPLRSFGPMHHRSTSLTQSGRRSSHTPSAPVFDPEATHYRDPEARKKLRMYLASPQKFDEAVEFGFPSTAKDDTVPVRYHLPPITTDARNFSRDMQTFLRDDNVSFLEDNDEDDEDGDHKSDTDGESITDVDSPLTPSSIGLSFRGHTRHVSPSNFSSVDSTGFQLPSTHPMHGRLNREMTLRMTLTRPDLRADEDQLYGWQGQAQPRSRDDPFALEELHLSDDMTGSKGAFAVKPKSQGNLVTRLFKRASKRGW